MPTPFAENIDWTRPWYASIKSAAETVIGCDDWLSALNRQSEAMGLSNHRGQPLSFVDQSALPAGSAYESFISATGCIPTRDNLHDWFNALVWLSFPRIKRQLNALQAAQIERAGIGQTRGAARDAVTIFDENAALLVVSDSVQGRSVLAALREHAWHSAFLDQRDSFGQHAEVWLFGHALMEKLVTPYKGITGHAWVVTAPEEFRLQSHAARREWLDLHVANQLTECDANGLSTACFTPLPVLGIPAWWPSQDRAFYDDATVFRPRRGS
ncbi:MAG TPA: DUF3025 domain-containing protein [Rhodocyclaceae bacterium]|nr:DUF3025 domain-containing protein [Rhodocyclaceae bacterium]